MRNRFILGAIIASILVWAAASLYVRLGPSGFQPFSEADLANARVATAVRNGETNFPTPAAVLPLKLSHPVRLAVGWLGEGG